MKPCNPSSSSHFALAILMFSLAVGFSFMLLFGALIVWLAIISGSIPWALAIAGAISLVAAAVIYWTAIRKTMQRINHIAQIVCQTGRTCHQEYLWIASKINSLKSFCSLFMSSSPPPSQGQ